MESGFDSLLFLIAKIRIIFQTNKKNHKKFSAAALCIQVDVFLLQRQKADKFKASWPLS